MLLVKLLQQALAVLKVLFGFPGVFGMWVTFPFHKVLLTLLFQDLLDLEYVLFLDLEVEHFL